ncbi:E3 ubiquitin/ISG15 ligase TRIM25-like isoform X1 [Astatotilapia calliptera]|uniref:Uncharacterized protein n=1 Tax=Astatotilapia calliptera TaxID=8154 RepID=A0AAX7TI54_ASTCA|nr:E3 ubiquitin/ISG15 ligase TRIM25-like isoform X1 [Astatotilapia calliptera]
MPQLDREKLCCSICLDLLKDPVTLPCGHSYCMICINNHWDGEDQRGVHSCPQCRKTFIPRPVLGKNTMLAELVEELKKTELQAAPPVHHNYAGPGDVPCDFCTGRKQRATKSCLQCLASYCDDHLQPHYDSQAFQSHKLVEASANLQEKICSLHNKVKEVFCRSDKQCICYLCSISEHKGHDVVSLAAERAERQNELDPCRQNIQQRIQDLEQDLTVLQKQVGVINISADEAARNSQMVFSQLAQLIARRSSEVQQQIRIQQETETRRVKELEEKLQNEIAKLKKKDSELKQLSYTEDHHRFLLTFYSLSALGKSTHTGVNVPPLSFEEVTAAVSQLKDKLQDLLSQGWTQGEAPLRPAELEGSGKQPHIVPAPTSFITKEEEVKSAAFQQPRVVPPAEPKSFLKQPRFPPAPHLTAFLATAARKNSLKHVVPPAEPTALAPLHPALVTPPLPFAPPTEPKTRNEFLQYMCPITLDPNTVSKWLSLSEGNRKVTYMKKEQSYPDHPERFDSLQVLGKEALSGRCYWEVKWSKFVAIAVAYKSISRTGSESGFGFNDKSWALWCHSNEFRHDSTTMSLQVPQSSKIGVYVDQSAGILSFHSVSGSMTLLAKVETTFTEPLHVGLWVCSGSAKLVQLL